MFHMRPRFETRCRFMSDPRAVKRLIGFDRSPLPSGVLPADMLRALPGEGEPPLEAGVYFLWRGPMLVYVGQSCCLQNRLTDHELARDGVRPAKRIPFSRRTWLTCRADQREKIEALYIRAYRPPYNEKIP